MHGYNSVLSTLEFTDSLLTAPGNDKSCVTLSFSTNVPSLQIPVWVATPIGLSTKPGSLSYVSPGSKIFHPFLTSFIISFSRKHFLWKADLWLPRANAATKSFFRSSSSKRRTGNVTPLVSDRLNFFHRGCFHHNLSNNSIRCISDPNDVWLRSLQIILVKSKLWSRSMFQFVSAAASDVSKSKVELVTSSVTDSSSFMIAGRSSSSSKGFRHSGRDT